MIHPDVDAYLASVDAERAPLVRDLFHIVDAAMPGGYEQAVEWGGVSWQVPLADYPVTYNSMPLPHVGLSARKRYLALYLHCFSDGTAEDAAFRARWAASGRRLDMGRSCLRFRSMDDLDLGLLQESISGTSPDALIALYELSRVR